MMEPGPPALRGASRVVCPTLSTPARGVLQWSETGFWVAQHDAAGSGSDKRARSQLGLLRQRFERSKRQRFKRFKLSHKRQRFKRRSAVRSRGGGGELPTGVPRVLRALDAFRASWAAARLAATWPAALLRRVTRKGARRASRISVQVKLESHANVDSL
jgi:hypothetical protein